MIRIKDISFFSSIGQRPNQEDYILATNDKANRIFVLCDGMGGHGHGEVASKTVAEAVHAYLTELAPEEYTPENIQESVDFALAELAKADIYNDEKAMGTTVVVIAINRMNILVGHVGDSRCYQFSEDGLKKFRTKDHSVVQNAVDAEIMTEEEAWVSPKKNILTRCLTSSKASVKVEIDSLEIEDNDTLLLCSDGVTDALRDSQLQSIILGRSVEKSVACIRTECDLSSRDNFSLILVSFSQDEVNRSKTIEHRQETKTVEKPMPTTFKLCACCERKVSEAAIYCPYCGNPTDRIDYKKSSWVQDFLKKMAGIHPLWLVAGGAVAGGIITGCCCHFLYPGGEPTQQYASTIEQESISGMSQDYFKVSDVTCFIDSQCAIDSAANPQDTIIIKRDLLNNYASFVNSIKNSDAK